jgi:hypothetical protein
MDILFKSFFSEDRNFDFRVNWPFVTKAKISIFGGTVCPR